MASASGAGCLLGPGINLSGGLSAINLATIDRLASMFLADRYGAHSGKREVTIACRHANRRDMRAYQRPHWASGSSIAKAIIPLAKRSQRACVGLRHKISR